MKIFKLIIAGLLYLEVAALSQIKIMTPTELSKYFEIEKISIEILSAELT